MRPCPQQVITISFAFSNITHSRGDCCKPNFLALKVLKLTNAGERISFARTNPKVKLLQYQTKALTFFEITKFVTFGQWWGKKRIIIFDDDSDLLDIFAFLFEEDGWDAYTFQSCDEVIRIGAAFFPDLVVTDNWIPSIGGIAATQLLKGDASLKKIPVIYVSANNDVGELSKKAGAEAFVAKPFNFDPLLALARSLVNKKS